MLVLMQEQEIACLFSWNQLKFTRVINGLVSEMKATSITHSAKEALEASVSWLLFFSRQVRAMLKRRRKKSNDPAVSRGARVHSMLECPSGPTSILTNGAPTSHSTQGFPLLPEVCWQHSSIGCLPISKTLHGSLRHTLGFIPWAFQNHASVSLSMAFSPPRTFYSTPKSCPVPSGIIGAGCFPLLLIFFGY
jgi:hypothetical protein